MHLSDPGTRATVMHRMAYVLQGVVIPVVIANAAKHDFSFDSVIAGVLAFTLSSVVAMYLWERSADKDAYLGAIAVTKDTEAFKKVLTDKIALGMATMIILGALAKLFR